MPPSANLGIEAKAAKIDATAATAMAGPTNGMDDTEEAAPVAAASAFALASAFFAVTIDAIIGIALAAKCGSYIT